MTRSNFPITTASELAALLGMALPDLWYVAMTAETSYIYWEEAKSSGGVRTYSTPKPKLMTVQRKLHKHLFLKLAYGTNSHYGQKRKSSITNAREHLANSLIVTRDLKSFFPSVRPDRVYKALINEMGCPAPVARLITKLVTVKYQLPQGAPTSTDIANIVTLRLQRRLHKLAQQWGVKKFTIYCDDMTFSSDYDYIPEGFDKRVQQIIREEGFRIHRHKGGTFNKSQSQIVTGVNITHGASVGKTKKQWRAEHHKNVIKFRQGEISKEEFEASEKTFDGRKRYSDYVKKTAHL